MGLEWDQNGSEMGSRARNALEVPGLSENGNGLGGAEYPFSPTGEKVARMRRMRGSAIAPSKDFFLVRLTPHAPHPLSPHPLSLSPLGERGWLLPHLMGKWADAQNRLEGAARQRRVPALLCFVAPSVSPFGRSTSPFHGEEGRGSPKKDVAFWFQGMSLGLLGQSESRMASKPYSDTFRWLVSTKRPAGMKESSEMALTWKKAWFSTVSMRAPR